ncbi:terminase [Mycetocola tolaasinivorans]|uniref:Terminase n=1 Tax=Mycetocola tolaasinivorans TaxID=76635 RepID=A0A3L7A469_9MICO|nr:terminase [Mycetocola tolaasinivorans]
MEAKCAEFDVEFDPWQKGAGSIALGKTADGVYAATVGGITLSIPRQVGKTFFVGMIVIALCVLFPNMTVLWTAHRTRTSTMTFTTMKGMVRKKKIWPHIKAIRSTNGEQEIQFVNGSVIMFGAREQGFGRGFDSVDIEVFDEAQILTEKALEDMVPAANASKHEAGALLFFMGTPPRPNDPGVEFTNRRAKAIAEKPDGQVVGRSEDSVYIEFSADEGANPDDHKQWAKANPSFPTRTPVASMKRMRANLTDDDSFNREALGIWDRVGGGSRHISAARWKKLAVDGYPTDGVPSYGVAFSADGDRVALAGAFEHDGPTHLELIDVTNDDSEQGLTALADWFCEDVNGMPRWKRSKAITIGGQAGAAVLKQLLQDRKVPPFRVHIVTTPQYLQSCSMLDELAKQGDISHRNHEGQAALDASVAITNKDKRGGWTATVENGDETPMEAISLALWGAKTTKRKPPGAAARKAVIL